MILVYIPKVMKTFSFCKSASFAVLQIINGIKVEHLLPAERGAVNAPRVGDKRPYSIMEVCRGCARIACVAHRANLSVLCYKGKRPCPYPIQVSVIVQPPFWAKRYDKLAAFAIFCGKEYNSPRGRVYACAFLCEHVNAFVHDGTSPSLVPTRLVVLIYLCISIFLPTITCLIVSILFTAKIEYSL